jgi:DNA-binding transcriptional MerR regulator
MRQEQSYSISDLAEQAGVTPRTIRYYTAEGLLPAPDTRGKYARYGEEHLLRLQMIARLKERYLPLGEIRAQLEALTSAELRTLLSDQPGIAPAPVSATEYITRVLQQHTGSQVAESAARYQAPTAPQRQPHAQAPIPASPAAEASPPAPDQAKQRAQRNPLAPGQPVTGTYQPSIEQQEILEEARWRRILLAPGVELHLRQPQAPDLQAKIEELLGWAEELFQKRGEDQ